MKRTIIFLLSFVLMSCSSSKYIEKNFCNENVKFRAKFYKNVNTIEEYTEANTTISSHTNKITLNAFFKSLDFITKYTKTPYPDVFNLHAGYRSMIEFQADKKKWLDWYDKNKCNNIH